jgi:hypothetical protein
VDWRKGRQEKRQSRVNVREVKWDADVRAWTWAMGQMEGRREVITDGEELHVYGTISWASIHVFTNTWGHTFWKAEVNLRTAAVSFVVIFILFHDDTLLGVIKSLASRSCLLRFIVWSVKGSLLEWNKFWLVACLSPFIRKVPVGKL